MPSAQELFQAIEAGDTAAVKALVATDASLASAKDEKGLSAVLVAQYRHQKEILEVLLAAKPGLDIFEAAAVGDRGRAAELLAADPKLARAWSVDGGTALHLACFFRQPEIAGILVRGGADVNAVAPGFGNVTPLHSAVAGRHPKIVALLLEAGAKPNVVQQGGWTPLHATAMHGDETATRLLLTHGADPTLKVDNGQTAIDMAREKGHTEVVTMLESAHGAA